MDNIKNLDALILKATSEANEELTHNQLKEILELVNSRADMPKHAIASISKRLALKNRRVLINCFTLLEFLVYETELALYSQVATKEFLFKISGLLLNKDLEPIVKTKIMETVFCCEQLFRPHEDLLPLFFHFYAGLLRNNFDIPHTYKSPFRPAQLKQYKKQPVASSSRKPTNLQSSRQQQPATSMQRKTFEEIRQKLILTNQIIDNANPGDNVKDNALLLQMIDQIKECEKKVNKTINENPSESLMEMALAANDDIFITYRRYKDLQRNKKPEPFILTELVSEGEKQSKASIIPKTQPNKSSSVKPTENSPTKSEKQKQIDFLDFDEPKKVEKPPAPKNEDNLFDMDFAQPKKEAPKPVTGGDIFDLIDCSPSQPVTQPPVQNNSLPMDIFSQPNPPPPQQINSFDDLLLTTNNQAPYQSGMGIPQPSGNGISLNMTDFSTQADMKNYNNKTTMEKFNDLTYDFLKK